MVDGRQQAGDPMPHTDRQARADAFIRDFAPRLYRYALVRLGRTDLADDAVGETLCRLVELGPDLSGDERHVKGWSVRCMVNVCREFERRPKLAQEPIVAREIEATGMLDARDNESSAALVRAMAKLPPRQREAVTLRILLEHSVAETAEAMACAPGTVKALTHQGLASLQGLLSTAAITIGLAS